MNLTVKGKEIFLGKKISVIEGGFGLNQRCILVRDIAEIHEISLFKINELIKRNLDEFEMGVDMLEILGVLTTDPQIGLDLGFSQDAINSIIGKQGKLYLLSERGYITLAMLMRTEKAKEVRRQFKKEYFAMREALTLQTEYIKVLEKNQELLMQRNNALEEIQRLNAVCAIPRTQLKKDIRVFMNSYTRDCIFESVEKEQLYNLYRETRKHRPAQPPRSMFDDIVSELCYHSDLLSECWLDIVIKR